MASRGRQSLFAPGDIVIEGSAHVVGITRVGSLTADSLTQTSLDGSGSVDIPGPGFYRFSATGSSGEGYFTGSLPDASLYPGASLMVFDSAGTFNYLLVGNVTMVSGSTLNSPNTLSSVNGTKLDVEPGGSVGLWSNSRCWIVNALSGTLTIS